MIETTFAKLNMSERTPTMTSVSQVAERLQSILEERACELARETGCVKRLRKFSGADLVQMLVFGFHQHPHASHLHRRHPRGAGD